MGYFESLELSSQLLTDFLDSFSKLELFTCRNFRSGYILNVGYLRKKITNESHWNIIFFLDQSLREIRS